ncbi:InlB B-repeat-containing protein [Prevotella communis]|uniref:InlB B-repeat-containing protein n=1 Tax=Prevotella communis TaxID=2913614 RepID=UPI001EDBE8DC|nr:InlB B-repeat-containing protein [Prevotella communis]UKK60787.1 InlB B-repeat-containing protein [Prevotella communis]UKK63613.1 InlB B-repeat-containing protein [Prevotella communis]
MSIKKDFFAPLASGLGATRRAAMLLLVMMLTTATAWAQTTITPTTPSQDGDGFYSIGSAAELYGFAELVNNGNASANAKLTADIVVNENVLDANGEANTGDFVQWTPIGNDYFEGKVYSGTFDGQGHTVSGLYVSGSSWRVGLVGAVSGSAVVKNLGIVDSYFSSSNNFLGSIVGGVANNSSVTLANVYSTSTVKGDNWIGGLAGGGDGSVSVVNSYFAGKTSANWAYGTHHDDLVAGDFDRSTLTVCNAFVLGTSQYGTSVTAEQLSDGTVAAALHYYQDALADGSMFGLSGGKTNFSGTIDGVSVTTANITLHTFDGDATAYSSKYIVGNTTPLPVNVEREGYTFFGWYDNADLEGDAVTSISSSETDDKEYWAKFERSHAVSFVLGGGTIRSGEIDHYIEGETTVLPTYVTKVGASFEGWYTTEDFTGSRYYSIPATATEDMTFYAKWGEVKTTFYLVQGGSPEPVSILYEGESIVWLDKTTTERYVISDNFYNYWGSNPDINVPYTGGESTFGNYASEFSVAQSGFYVFTLTDKGGESWFVSILKSMLNCDVASIPTQVYTGSAIEPDVTVKDGETTLTLGTDYEVAYSNNVNAGTATVTITGKGNYSGESAATFTIVKSMTNDGITIAAIADQTYTGSAIEPAVTVTDGEKTLTLGTDYTIGYFANVNVGTATATITGKGNYTGSREATFTIVYPTVTTSYVEADGTLHENVVAIPLINAMTTLPAGTYVVNSDVAYTGTVTLSGDVTLILGDGKTMTVTNTGTDVKDRAIYGDEKTLHIYGQSQGTGALTATAVGGDAAICLLINQKATSLLGIHGGVVSASTEYASGNGILVQCETDAGGIVIDGGQVTASGNNFGIYCEGGHFDILGGQVTATGTNFGGLGICDCSLPGVLTLGYSKASDFVSTNSIYNYCGESFAGEVKIADDQTLVDGNGNIWSGTLSNDEIQSIHNQTLRPVTGVALTKDGNNVSATFNGSSETTVSIPVDVNVTSVTYNRAFTEGKPSTVMLPFSLGEGQTLTGGKLYKFSGVTKNETTGKWEATMTETTTLQANTPYLLMPDNKLTDAKVTFDLNNNTVTLNTNGGGNCETAAPGSHWTFKGTYRFKEWNSNDYNDAEEIGRAYGFAGVAKDGINVGDFVRVASGAKIRPMRAYLLWNDMPNAANARSFTRGAAAKDEELPQSIIVRLVGSNGETTAIGTLDTETGEMTFDSEAWYTLDGVRLSGKPSKKGLYINNGRKVVIK